MFASTSTRALRRVAFAPQRLTQALLSTSAPSPGPSLPVSVTPKAPTELNDEVTIGIQDATRMYMRHGIGKQKLDEIAAMTTKDATVVMKWQRMMEAFLGTQVHILAGMGYAPNEQGLANYNMQLATLVQAASPEVQEALRIKGRDIWREVLTAAFGLDQENLFEEELSIVDARNIMHKVSLKMQDEKTLASVKDKCDAIVKLDQPDMVMAQKHHIVQEVLVNEVYLGGEPSLVEECGFGPGEHGYVKMQCIMAEHQNDPLVAQYIGTSMLQLLKSAGLDMESLQKAAQASSDNK